MPLAATLSKGQGWIVKAKPSLQPRPPWIELRLALPMLRQWFDAISAGALSGFMGFQNWRMAPCPDPKALPAAETSIELRLALPMLRQWFDAISAGTLSGFMGFQNWRMAPCPDPKAFPAAETPLDWAAAGFTHAAAMVWCDFGWHPVWFYEISKLTDGPLSRSQSPPRSRNLLGLSCGWLYPCCSNGLMGFRLATCLVLWVFKTDGWPPVPIPKPSPQPRPPLSCGWLYPCCGNGLMRFRLAPCLALWDFKTDGWPPVPIPKPSPQPRPPWIELWLALPMLRQWFDGISAGNLSGFMGFQNWRMAPCPDPKALPAAETSLNWAAAGFTHATAMVWCDFGWHPVWLHAWMGMALISTCQTCK